MKIEIVGSIADSTAPIKRSGKLAGGGSITFDVPEAHIDKLAALMSLVLLPLKITIELADGDTLLTSPAPRRGKRVQESTSPTEQDQTPRPEQQLASQPRHDDPSEAEARKVLEEFRQQMSGKKTAPRPDW